ncbi:dermonecrotic toxin domain-containing protein [Pseudomonas pergaminensis]
MARVTPPYFFDEFLLPVRRDEPSPRERALGLSLKDLDWLHTLYYATDHARQNAQLRAAPMVVESFTIKGANQPTTALAGVFLMSPSPDGQKAVLYTPYGGMEVFDGRDSAMQELINRINNKSQGNDLFSFLSIDSRKALQADTALSLTHFTIDGAVLEFQEQTILAAQQQNLLALLNELRQTPTLEWMLQTLLGIMARTYFPKLDQRDTRVNCYADAPPGTASQQDQRWVASLTLSETLLQFYLSQAWPSGQTRTFFNPRHVTTGFSPEQLAQDLAHWHSLVEQASGVLSKVLGSLLKTYWNADARDGQSRLAFFAQVMRDTFRTDLLLKRQAGIISSDESQHLLAVLLPNPAVVTNPERLLHIDKVRIHAPYQHHVELAGTLMITDQNAYLYTQPRGLQVLKDQDDLKDTLISMLKAAGHQDELLNFLSREERTVFIGLDPLQISGVPINGNVFATLAADIAVKQLSNLEHALALFRRSDGAVDLAALLDCALDVRSLFDPRLLDLDAEGRWSLNPIASHDGRPSTVKAERAKQELPTLRAIEAALATERANHSTLRHLAAHALNTQLDSNELDLKAEEVNINTYASAAQQFEEREPQVSLNMVEHFLERLTGEAVPVMKGTHLGFYGLRERGGVFRLNSLTPAIFNKVIEQAMVPFVQHDVRTLPGLFLDTHQGKLSQGMLEGLRSEARLRHLSNTLDERSHAIIHTVLEGDSLTRLTRHGLNGFLPDVFSLALHVGAQTDLHALANCFVITERGGTDPQLSGKALLWTPRLGFQPFASVAHLYTTLQQYLAHPDGRMHLLENLPVRQRAPHQAYRLAPLQRIDDHLVNNRQRSYRDYVLDSIDYRLTMGLGARRLQDSLDSLMRQPAPLNLRRAAGIAQSIIQQEALPAWLGMAAPLEQRLHAELLEQYRLSAPDEQDYLHGIPPLREHVVGALATLLNARFASAVVNPEHVLISARQTLSSPIQTLVDLAMCHLPDFSAGDVQPRSSTAVALPAALDSSAVEQLVRQLDLKSVYRDWFDTHLNADTEDARQRRALFCRQLPWQLLCHAHEERLEERLSSSAWSLIQQIFDMPDALARDTVSGVTAMIRPLELIATPGATAAPATGLYLISPQAGASGPLVLYTPYRPKQALQEYVSEDDLLHELGNPGALQDWVLRHLDSAHQATYRNLWQRPTRSGPSELRFGTSPVRGNILLRLFNDNRVMLGKMLESQFDAEGQAQWERFTGMVGKGIPNAVQFMAGKLAYPLVVWRSYQLFKDSAEHLQQHQWGAALKAFARGVASLASLRKELDKLLDSPVLSASQPTVDEWLNTPPPAAATLATMDLTQPLRTGLQVFEDHSVALSDLEKSALSHVFKHAATGRFYVPVEGKVYPVKRAGERWRLDRSPHEGPYVQRNAQDKWVLDLDRHHPRFGKSISRFAMRVNTRLAEREAINIEAVGMAQIGALSSWKAQCINEALNVATYYTVNCKRNLLKFADTRDPASRLGRFFNELFGLHTVTAEQVTRIEKRIDEVLNELVDHTLTNPDSMRFVTGTSRWGSEDTYGFTLPADSEKKIYLVDRFFDPMVDVYQNRLSTPFDLSAHARAATLIHEITHLSSDTEDIAYLDSMRPFHDLINVDIQGAQTLSSDLSELRRSALSTLTPDVMLFKAWDAYSQSWEDLGDRHLTRPVKERVLKLTGAKTLDDARKIFMSNEDKRMDIILANADSVTYLITQLGRELDKGA